MNMPKVTTASAIVSLLELARRETAKLPRHSSWKLPYGRALRSLSIFPGGYGCYPDRPLTGFDIICFYADWGSVKTFKEMLHHQKLDGTAGRSVRWLERAGFNERDRVWHTNVLLAFRVSGERGDHDMYRSHSLMQRSAEINAMVEREMRPRLNVTFGIPAAVAFCHTHPGGDHERHFESYNEHKHLRNSKFTLKTLYQEPYPLDDGSIVVHLCHPDNSHLNAPKRWKQTRGKNVDGEIALLKEGLKLAKLL